MSDIAAILLAAGEASRFRAAAGASGPQTKLVALHGGKPLVRHVAEAACAAGLSPVLVVTGHAREAVLAALSDCPVTPVHNPDYASGMASSLKAGLAQVPQHARAVMVLLGDMPLVTPQLIRALVDAFEADATIDAVVPVHRGERGNPVLLSTRLAPELMKLTGDAGARQILRAPGLRILEVPVDDLAARIDIDTPEALAALAASSSGARQA